MKKIVILGAGIYQVPLIRAAKKLGLYVIAASIQGNYPGFDYADKSYYINTTDHEAILAMAMEEDIAAIATTGTDVAVSTIGYVCDRMRLAGISLASSEIVTDKSKMKEAFLKGGVATAEFEAVHSAGEACDALEKIGAPVMLKIVDKSGSRGITKVSTADEMKEAYGYAEAFTASDVMIVEKYISGKEIGIDAFVQDGELKLVIPHDKIVFHSERTGIPMGHICPMDNCSDSLRNKMENEVSKVIKSTGLNDCAVNMDVFITENEDVYVIEAAGRCGATGIPEVISSYTGLDYYDMILKNALGEKIDIPDRLKYRPSLSVLIHSDMTGILNEVSYEFGGKTYVNEPCFVKGMAEISLDYSAGDEVHAFENGTHRIGQAVFMADTREQLLKMLSDFRKSLKVSVVAEGQTNGFK